MSGEARKDKAAKVAAARTLWVPAVNNHGGFGRWAFVEVTDPWDARGVIRMAIANAYNADGSRLMSKHLAVDPDVLAQFCRRHGIARLALFGSVLRGQERPDSDVDLLVEFLPGQRIGLIGLAAIERELSALVGPQGGSSNAARPVSAIPRRSAADRCSSQYAA